MHRRYDASQGQSAPAMRISMARLRHFAVCVKDIEKAAEFYANVFDLKRIGREDLEIGSAIYMSDGGINLALLNFTGAAGSKASDIKDGATFVGAHHSGFQDQDLADTEKPTAENAGKYFQRPPHARPWNSAAHLYGHKRGSSRT